VRVDARAGVAHAEGVPEEGRARAFLEALGRRHAEKLARTPRRRDGRLRVGQDKDVLGPDALLLDARGREEDVRALADRDAAAGAGYPAELVELGAEVADQVGRLDERTGKPTRQPWASPIRTKPAGRRGTTGRGGEAGETLTCVGSSDVMRPSFGSTAAGAADWFEEQQQVMSRLGLKVGGEGGKGVACHSLSVVVVDVALGRCPCRAWRCPPPGLRLPRRRRVGAPALAREARLDPLLLPTFACSTVHSNLA
jgi:hypothetical protein